MKYVTFAAAALALAACSKPAETPQAPETNVTAPVTVAAPTGEYALDPHHTTVTIAAKHFGLSNYILRFNVVSGKLNFNAEDPTQSTINATVAINSLDTPYTGDRNFDAELQNSEWLDAATHPTATFSSTSIERTGPNTARVTGTLSIRGIARPVTFDVTYNGSHARHPMGIPSSHIGFSAVGTIQRSEYGIDRVLMPTAADGGDGVANAVEIRIEAEFSRPVESDARTPAEPVD